MRKSFQTYLLRVFLAFVITWGGALSLPALALADTLASEIGATGLRSAIIQVGDVRPTDIVADEPLGEGHPKVPDAPNIVADYAALCTKDGLVLWERNSRAQVPMASATKIMTALVALEHRSLDSTMIVTYGAAYTDGSSANLRVGDTLTLRQLIYCMMVPSGNDASVAIAENVSGTEYNFTKLMNEKAAQLGMVDTHFSNASGLIDDGNYTTARDYLILVRVAMANDFFRETVAMQYVELEVSGRKISYYSTNYLLGNFYGANGVKTGFTDAAGYCLVASAKRNNFEFYAVVFHSSSESQRFSDARVLLEWGFAHYRTVDLINAAIPVAELACLSWIDKTVSVVAESPVSVELFDYNGPVTQDVTLVEREGTIRKGEVVGYVIWMQNGEVLAKVDLVAAETVYEPGFWERIGIWWDRFWGSFSGKPKHATSTTNLPKYFDLKIVHVNS